MDSSCLNGFMAKTHFISKTKLSSASSRFWLGPSVHASNIHWIASTSNICCAPFEWKESVSAWGLAKQYGLQNFNLQIMVCAILIFCPRDWYDQRAFRGGIMLGLFHKRRKSKEWKSFARRLLLSCIWWNPFFESLDLNEDCYQNWSGWRVSMTWRIEVQWIITF